MGFVRGFSVVRCPLALLHFVQQLTTFSQRVTPPLTRGTTWSTVTVAKSKSHKQYWHRKWSRSNMLYLLNLMLFFFFT